MALATPISETLAGARAWLNSQLAQAERLHSMLAVAAAVILLALLVGAISTANQSVRDLRAAQTELARLKQQVRDGSWSERKLQSETLRFQLYERLWTAETAGLAEASLDRWLRERFDKQGVRPDAIRVQRSAVQASEPGTERGARTPLSGVQRMTAKVTMPFEPEAVLEVLNAVAASEKVLVVDRLLMRGGRNSLIEMDISTFVMLPEVDR